MTKKQVKKLFEKYINDECSSEEVELLNNYLDSFQDEDKLWSELKYDDEIKQKLLLKIKSQIETGSRRKVFSIGALLKYAAILIGIAGFVIAYRHDTQTVNNKSSLVVDKAITLRSSNDRLRHIDTKREQTLVNHEGIVVGKQKGKLISFDKNDEIKEVVYNEIRVPNGKKIELLLSDGTAVHINSGSSLRFPINFIPDHKREVFLKGEAYFEVAKNLKSPFSVTTDDMQVKVLGTHFNVSSYQDAEVFAVLAEGSVTVSSTSSFDKEVLINRSGEKAALLKNDSINVNTVDLKDYLGWREGKLMFNDEPFVDILHKIERHYGVVIENDFSELSPVRFRGAFKEETIIDLLETFKESAGFKYEIEDNKILIKE